MDSIQKTYMQTQSKNNRISKINKNHYNKRISLPALDKIYSKEKRKNTGLIERLYNQIKNLTGLGLGSKKVEMAVQKAKKGEITEKQAVETIKKYNSSQETSAQLLGDGASVLGAGVTYFGLNKFIKMNSARAQLNNDFIKGLLEDLPFKKFTGKLLNITKSKTKQTVLVAGIAALTGGFLKSSILQLNRIGSNEFKTKKQDFNNLETPLDKMMYKETKKQNRKNKIMSNIKNYFSGVINGAMLPLTLVGGPFIGIPLYILGNSLNRFFIGSRHQDKSLEGFKNNLVDNAIPTLATTAMLAVPIAKKANFTHKFEKNLKIATDKLLNANLKAPDFKGKTVYDELSDILMNSEKISSISRNRNIEQAIKDLTKENIFAVKFKQISNDGSELARILKDNCPPTRNLTEAQNYITKNLGAGYEVKQLLGVGTVAETYLAKDSSGKEVCIKIIKEGINLNKVKADKEKFANLIKASNKSNAEKDYLLRNLENLSEGISKELDLESEMNAAKELKKFTTKANVVKPLEVKNNVYVMEKANGISLNSFMELNNALLYKEALENKSFMLNTFKPKPESKLGKLIGKEYDNNKILEIVNKYIDEVKARTPNFEAINLSKDEAKKLYRKYNDVLIEQFNKIDKNGKAIHADIHPGNIFIDLKALKDKKGKVFTLIDTGNIVNLSKEQSIRDLQLASYLKHGNVKDITEYVLDGAKLPDGMTKEQAIKELSETLNKAFFDTETEIGSVTNDSILAMTSNIMKEKGIIPNDNQLNLLKAKTSADNSRSLLQHTLVNLALKDMNVLDALDITTKLAKLLVEFWNEDKLYKNLCSIQEKLNLKQLSLAEQAKYKNNPNNLKENSENYLLYQLKQFINSEDNNIFS